MEESTHNTFPHQLITSVKLSFTNQENLCNLPTSSRKHQQLLGCADNRAPCMLCILSRRPQYIKPCRHGKLHNNFAQTCHTTMIPGSEHKRISYTLLDMLWRQEQCMTQLNEDPTTARLMVCKMSCLLGSVDKSMWHKEPHQQQKNRRNTNTIAMAPM